MPSFSGEPRLEEIAEGVHAFLQPDGGWCLNNSGLLVTEDGPVLIDTAATETRARRLRALALRAAGAPPRLLVNTHAHGDHTFGNFVFPEALVIGHEDTRREAEQTGLHLTGLWPQVQWGAIELVLPHLTFTGQTTLRLGGDPVELHSFGPAHSSRDTAVWLPRQRVLFTGDLVMSGVTPFVLTGSVSGLRHAVTRLRALDAVTIVPGHGPVGGPELLDRTERYLDWVTALARTSHAEGLTPQHAARHADLTEFADLLDSERLAPNLHRAWEELPDTSCRPAEPQQLLTAMLDLHGGLPACHA